MLSALILSEHSYPAFTLGRITGTPEVRFSRSSRTKENCPSVIERPHRIETDKFVTFRFDLLPRKAQAFLLSSTYRYVVRTISFPFYGTQRIVSEGSSECKMSFKDNFRYLPD